MTATEQPAEHAAAPAVAERRGWYRTGAQRHDHWVDCGATALCGQDVPLAAAVVGLHDVEPNRGFQSGVNHVQACPACLDGLIQRLFGVTFRAGDRVTSRELGMTLHGTVERLFLDADGVPHLDLERFWIRPPADAHEQREREESGIKNWYRRADTCRPFTPKEAIMTTTSSKTTAKPRKASGKGKAAPAPTPDPQPVTTWSPGDFVVCRVPLEGRAAQSVSSGIIALNVASPPTYQVVNRGGVFTVAAADVVGQDDWPPRAALRAGDRVVRRPATGERFQVMKDADFGGLVELRNLVTGEPVADASDRDLRVEHRARIEDLYADLGLPTAGVDTPPAVTVQEPENASIMPPVPRAAGSDIDNGRGDRFWVGMFAAVAVDGVEERTLGAVLGIDPASGVVALMTDTGATLAASADRLATCTRRPVAPLRAGDLVRLDSRLKVKGRTFEVQWVEATGAVMVKSEETAIMQEVAADQVFVWKRQQAQDAMADIRGVLPDEDLPFPEPETTPAVEAQPLPAQPSGPDDGWARLGDEIRAHWREGGAMLCGLPASGQEFIVGRDLANAQMYLVSCAGCRRVINARGVIPAPDLLDTPFDVGQHVVFPYPHPTPDSTDVGVINRIYPVQGPKAYNKDCQVRRGTAFYYRNFTDLRPAPQVDVVQAPHDVPAMPIPAAEAEPTGGTPLQRRTGSLATLALPLTEDEQARAFPIPHIEPFRPGIRFLPWNRILASQLNPRKHFDQEGLIELAVSIHRGGLKQNLQARPHPTRPGFYEIVAGERRWRAIGLLVKGLEVGEGENRETLTLPAEWELPVLVEELTDAELVRAAMSENIQRNNMTPIEVADGFRSMVDGGLSDAQVATIFHRKVKSVIRLVQISRALAPGLRTLFDQGRLSQAQAELFALAPEPVQEHAEQDIRRTNVVPTVDQIKAFVLKHVFPVHVAQFPPPWYTGRVVEKDLFGDLPAFYADFGQALQLQERHAVALAQKDVERGAAFADVAVRPEVQLWNYEQGVGTGVLYWINVITGELKRYEGLRSNQPQNVRHHFEAPQPVPVHEAPTRANTATMPSASGAAQETAPTPPAGGVATAAAPVTPLSPTYPARKIAVNGYFQHALDVAQDTPPLLRAVALLGLINEDMRLTPASRAAAVEAARGCGGLLHVDDRGSLSVSYDHVPADGPMEAALLPALLALPGAVLDTLLAAHLAAWSEAFLTPDLIFAARPHVPDLPPFQLTEGYLKQCDRPALEELYRDAGLGSTQNTTAGYLRDELLTEAPRLAQAGFLPRPLRGEQP